MAAPDLPDEFFDAWVREFRAAGIDPMDAARVAFAETGMYQRHPRNPRAGVWPFIEATLRRMGWQGSAEEYTSQVSPTDQIGWYIRYLEPYTRYLRDDAMVYVANSLPAKLPAAYASGDDFVMTAQGDGTPWYNANPVLDEDKDGVITVGDLRTHLDRSDQGGRWNDIKARLEAAGSGSGRSSSPLAVGKSALPLAIAAAAAGAWYLYYTSSGARIRRRVLAF